MAGGERQTFVVQVNMDDVEGRRKGISKIWARARIADLMDEITTTGAQELAGEVKQTALTHGLVSAYTAFVAVDSTRVTEGEHGTTVAVPVRMPEGVRYETTVGE
jgi:Ca-activated chloride channel family protein